MTTTEIERRVRILEQNQDALITGLVDFMGTLRHVQCDDAVTAGYFIPLAELLVELPTGAAREKEEGLA